MTLDSFKAILNAVSGPVMLAFGVPIPLIPLVQHAIVTAENVKGSGADKKKVALSIVKEGLTVVSAATQDAVDHDAADTVTPATLDDKTEKSIGCAIDHTVSAVKAGGTSLAH